MITDITYGIIPLKKDGRGWQVYLIQHHHGGFWGFPKGHLEVGETPQQCAMRELKEETHLDVVRFLLAEPVKEEFIYQENGTDIAKTVYFFLAEVTGQAQIVKDHEIMHSTWSALSEAGSIMTHESGKQVCALVINLLSKI